MTVLNDGVMLTLFLLGLTLYFLLAERLLARYFPRPAENVTPAENAPLRGLRRLGVIHALIALAPVLGLLGTVNGMIATFRGLENGTASLSVGTGIHAALYSTEYGLALAIPAFLLSRLLK